MATNKVIEACIFDLDGVIVDTAGHHYTAWRRLANLLGFDIDEQFNETLKGVSRKGSLEAILNYGGITISEEEKQVLSDKKNDWYKELISDMSPADILPGVMSFLEDVKSKGIRICLGSASKNARTVLRCVGLINYFEAIVDGTDVTKAKPDPEVFLNGAKLLNTPANKCIVFEDAEKGIEAALNAGMLAIGVGKPDTLLDAHFRIEGFEGLTLNSLLKQVPKARTH